MKLIDISIPIREGMTVWPGDPEVKLDRIKSISEGDQCNLTELAMGVHTGTHIDAPLHFIENGAAVDEVEMETLIGPCLVVEIASQALITKEDLLAHDLKTFRRILFKTSNSKRRSSGFTTDFTALSADAAAYLCSIGFALVGIDYLSVEAFGAADASVHKILLSSGVVILEGLNLGDVEGGVYELICLPIRLCGSEGAPARALLGKDF